MCESMHRESSGGGIRTPDTRIMIPPDGLSKLQQTNDLRNDQSLGCTHGWPRTGEAATSRDLWVKMFRLVNLIYRR